MPSGLFSLLVVICVITGAIITRKAEICMLVGSLICCIYMYGAGFVTGWCDLFLESTSNFLDTFLVIACFGALIALLTEGKGSFGFRKLIARFCTTQQRTLLTTIVMCIAIFVDDYLIVLSVGPIMKGVFDERKLPRESLAFILDSGGAPVCVMIPWSNWAVFYAALFMSQDFIRNAGYTSGFAAYISALPFCFYPIFTLLIVVLFAVGIVPKIGPMKKAYQRVEETGKLYSDDSRKFNRRDEEDYQEGGKIRDFVIPMGVLIASAILLGSMLPAMVIALFATAVLYIPRKIVRGRDFLNIVLRGFCDMMPVIFLCMMAFNIGTIMQYMGLADFLISVTQSFLTSALMPVITFVLVSGLCFCTASLWGMCAVVVPIIFPLAASLGANPALIMAAVICGGAFGSHACFYSDCTIMSSNASGIETMEHAFSQFPYVAISAAASIIAFIIAGIALT